MAGLPPATAKGLWKKSLDLGLMTDNARTEGSEVCIPFSRHVLQAGSPNPPIIEFPRFSRLPAELHLRFFSFCDSPTLFQLMHTSSSIRCEAKKLFLSDPDAWYAVSAQWIIQGCYPGETTHDMEFMPYVEQLEVVCYAPDNFSDENYFEDEIHITDGEKGAGVGKEQDKIIWHFWHRVCTRFPRVSRVVLSFIFPQQLGTVPAEDSNKITRMCIPGVEVYFSFVTYEDRIFSRREKRTWRQLKDNEGWTEIPNYDQPRIVMPPKLFRGPIGAYESWIHKATQLAAREKTVKTMLVAAVEKHHFYGRHEPLTCPVPDCSAWFDQPEQFTTHMLVEDRINLGDHDRFLNQEMVPPEPFKALFATNEEELEELRQEAHKRSDLLRDLWGKDGTKRRDAALQAAIHQVDHDPLCLQGKRPAIHSSTLGDLLCYLDGY
ncbi:hypothetical protein C7974DRAFT_395132 [Boeremia exigua]|uniref:uncharacterized protein n=1 Tax=Boeremia exigua TaxID=749465 RepID=UPI001E8E7D4C|nr:uncharacterized protein C7974DRAFT_395132 [Boeremia exigua]KAH6629736.1 hypothetical protein C7974DRAFT_395132 [Boeremia exigua]